MSKDDKLRVLFPTVDARVLEHVNLNSESKAWLKTVATSNIANPILNPTEAQKFIDWIHKKYSVEWSYGSYLEDRSTLLAQSYLEETKAFIHLGIDFNLPADTQVAANFAAEVIIVDDDQDQLCGWGPRVILKPQVAHKQQVVLVYAHLKNISVYNGQKINIHDTIGNLGSAPYNGNWWPHLHLQAIDANFFFENLYPNQLVNLDGYGHSSQLELFKLIYPEPIQFL